VHPSAAEPTQGSERSAPAQRGGAVEGTQTRGRLGKELRLPEADEQIRTAEAALEATERPVRAPSSGVLASNLG